MSVPILPYSKKQLEDALALYTAGKVGWLFFSEGTYQVEVHHIDGLGSNWPLLQIDDKGHLLDGFCDCSEAENSGQCAHLAAAYYKIFGGHLEPIHFRFRDSLWNQLGKLASARHGSSPDLFISDGNRREIVSATGKKLFFIESSGLEEERHLVDLLFHRVEDTEETSLKFSNFSKEEMLLWRQGRPSHRLIYELSFWSDLAKWWMQLQDKDYQVTFSEESLPKWIRVQFAGLSLGIYIAEANWPSIIPALSTVNTPLSVFEARNKKIESIQYDLEQQRLLIECRVVQMSMTNMSKDHQIEIGNWIFVPNVGFFPSFYDSIFDAEQIPKDKIGDFLQKHIYLVRKFLKNTQIHPDRIPPKYHLYFDEQMDFHVCCYLFVPGDLQQRHACLLDNWAFLPETGFYLLEDVLFPSAEIIISKEKMGEFVKRHRIWLNGFEGFQIHISSIDSRLTFNVSEKGDLKFESGGVLTEESEEFFDFGEWIYLKGKGFFSKKIGHVGSTIRIGLAVPHIEINQFIHLHRDELENIEGFFASKCPLELCGLDMLLNEEGRIVVQPRLQFFSRYSGIAVLMLGDYTYVQGEGFAEIPYELRLPEGYLQRKIIPLSEEPHFIAYELDFLKPYILTLQTPLKKADGLFVRIDQMQPAPKAQGKEWLLTLNYITQVGVVDVYQVWKGLHENKKHLFTSAGLIHLKNDRFNWLKTISKKKWLKGGQVLRLTTLDWLQLCGFDDLRMLSNDGSVSNNTCLPIETLSEFHREDSLDLSGFSSTLRSYQEVGVKWLWFLYNHGLSGLLCDEMGLGKTHQAMGLIAAIHNLKKNKKCLVVCPTSVIYHWEELLSKFLPGVRVFIFYGVGRELKGFGVEDEILLTSYGTMRSEKKSLSTIEFELAVFDEVQIAKNGHSQTHKVMKMLRAQMRLGLTGTPIENRLLELKALFDVIVPGYMPQEAQFKTLFTNPIEKNQDSSKKNLLFRLVHPFMLRRKKSEVLLELPEKIEEIAYCDLSAEQSELYRNVYSKQKTTLIHDLENSAQPVPYMHVFALLSALKQICNHPCLITKQFENFQKHHSGKWDLFISLLQEVRDSGQKLVVFSQYLGMLNMIERYLSQNQIGFAGIQGSTRDRKAQLERFRQDPDCEVFVASLQAVGVGVDLVSASVVIHYDRWWNPARENQATDRVHRIGQSRGVQVFKLVTKGTIEEHIHQIIEKKMALTEGVLGFDEQDQVKGFNRKELIELMQMIDRDVH